MKKLLLVPTLLTVASTPLISLVGCGDPDTPEPTPVDEVIELNNLATGEYGEQLESNFMLLNTSTTYKLTADFSKTSKTCFSDIVILGSSEGYDMCITPLEFKIDKNNIKPNLTQEVDDNCFYLREYKLTGYGTSTEVVYTCSTQTNNSKLEFIFKFWAVPTKKVKFVLYDRIS